MLLLPAKKLPDRVMFLLESVMVMSVPPSRVLETRQLVIELSLVLSRLMPLAFPVRLMALTSMLEHWFNCRAPAGFLAAWMVELLITQSLELVKIKAAGRSN